MKYAKRTGVKTCPFSIGTIPRESGGIVPHIVPHIVPKIVPMIVPIELQKRNFCIAVGKENVFKSGCGKNSYLHFFAALV